MATQRIAVVGAGAIGSSTAFHLAARGAQVSLFEAVTVAAGASGRSAGLVRMHHPFLPDAVLARESFDEFRAFGRDVGGACGLVQTGFVRIVDSRLEPVLRKNVERMKGIGIVCEVVGARDFGRVDQRLDLSDTAFVAYEPESGYADPHLTASSYVEASGAEFHGNCAVTGLDETDRDVLLVTPYGEFGGFDAVALALGADANQLLVSSGMAPIHAYRRDHAVVFVRWAGVAPQHVASIDGPNDIYFRTEGSDLTLVGPSVRRTEDGQSSLGESLLERAITAISRRIPDLQHGAYQSGYVSWDTHTPDQHAIIDRLSPRVYCATGFSGSGFKLSPAVGLHLAAWILEGAPPAQLAPYGADRFARFAPIRESHGYGDRYFEKDGQEAGAGL